MDRGKIGKDLKAHQGASGIVKKTILICLFVVFVVVVDVVFFSYFSFTEVVCVSVNSFMGFYDFIFRLVSSRQMGRKMIFLSIQVYFKYL